MLTIKMLNVYMTEIKKSRIGLAIIIFLWIILGPTLSGRISAYNADPTAFHGKIDSCSLDHYKTGKRQYRRATNIIIKGEVYEYRLPFRDMYSEIISNTIEKIKNYCESNEYISGQFIESPTGFSDTINRIVYLSKFSVKQNEMTLSFFKRSLEYFSVVFMLIFLIAFTVFTFFKSIKFTRTSKQGSNSKNRLKKNRKSLKLKRKSKKNN